MPNFLKLVFYVSVYLFNNTSIIKVEELESKHSVQAAKLADFEAAKANTSSSPAAPPATGKFSCCTSSYR